MQKRKGWEDRECDETLSGLKSHLKPMQITMPPDYKNAKMLDITIKNITECESKFNRIKT